MGKVIANIHQVFSDREVAPNEVIDADAREERVLIATGRARYPLPKDFREQPDVIAEQVEADQRGKKRGMYGRKDMVAEPKRDPTPPVVAQSPVVTTKK